MEQYFSVLRTCPLFVGIGDRDLSALIRCLEARVEHFDKKETIFADGSPARYIGIVLSGSAQILQLDYYGNRSILSEVSPSELFAEAFACADVSDLPISVVASEPCAVMLIDCGRVLYSCKNACSFHQQMIFNLMKNLATKTILFHERIEATSKRSTREKLLTYLLMQSKKAGSRSFEIPFDRQELADYLEVERSGLSAEIGKLRKEGVLTSEKKRFTLL